MGLSARSTTVDAAIAVGAAVCIVAITRQIEPSAGERGLDALAYVVMLAAGGALALRRRAPRVAVSIITVALIVYTTRSYTGGPVYLTLAVALYSLAATARDRREALVTAGLAVGAMIVAGLLVAGGDDVTWHLAVFPGWAAAALFLGDAYRNRRDYLAGLEQRARFLEETREEEARRRVAEERLRIARDLHDVVAHSIATINLQSGVAAHVLERRPAAALEALNAIRRTSGEALQELRSTLEVLRAEGESPAPRAPTPGLARVDALAESTRQAGLAVDVRRTGAQVPVPVAVDVAGYRIVQESLTNVMRHAGVARAVVSIATMPDAVEIEVLDDGRGASTAANGGHGLAGMRERAQLVNGAFEAGPRPGGGFRVWARLPTGEVE